MSYTWFLGRLLLARRHAKARWVSDPVSIPLSEDSGRFGAAATGTPSSAAQHVAASLVICVSRIAE